MNEDGYVSQDFVAVKVCGRLEIYAVNWVDNGFLGHVSWEGGGNSRVAVGVEAGTGVDWEKLVQWIQLVDWNGELTGICGVVKVSGVDRVSVICEVNAVSRG